MNLAQFPDIPPRKRPVQRIISQIVLFVLGRSLQSLSRHDPLIQQEVRGWQDGFTLMMVIRPNAGSMAVRKTGGDRLAYLGAHYPEENADVIIYIKSMNTAFQMLTGRLGIDRGYARHSMCAKGDLSNTLSVVRVLNIAETYLFPSLIARNLMKRLPPIPFGRKWALRLKAYFAGVPFGL